MFTGVCCPQGDVCSRRGAWSRGDLLPGASLVQGVSVPREVSAPGGVPGPGGGGAWSRGTRRLLLREVLVLLECILIYRDEFNAKPNSIMRC